MYDDTLKKVHFQKSRCYPRVFFAIRKYFPPSASILRHPQVFSAIRKYSPPSASIFRYPQVFSVIRKYFPLSATNSSRQAKNPRLNMEKGDWP
ncbi:hypothetical protein E2R56_24105 [Rhodococcus qingshengii]|nr:hypothetical protein E2R56_24105 [Rhodococcus qingshengii]